MTEEIVLTRREGGVLHITMNRPDARNAMSQELLDGIDAAVASVADDRTCRAIVLRGAGKSFSAGGDVRGFKASQQTGAADGTGGADPIAERNRQGGAFFQRMDRTPQPLIVVADGAALGGGFGLVCAADIVIATPRARFGLTEARLGVLPAAILPVVIGRIGERLTRRLAVMSNMLSGAEAVEIGIIDWLCEDADAAEQKVTEVLAEILKGAPGAIARAKTVIRAVRDHDVETALDIAATQFAAAQRSDEATEGVQAFIDKRPPDWAGE